MPSRLKLEGARVLIVENEALVALHIAEMLGDLGCVPVGPAGSVEAALAAINDAQTIDCAILDVRLDDGISGHVAGALLAKNIPFVICSGYRICLPDFGSIPILEKPIQKEQFKIGLERALSMESGLSLHYVNGFAAAGARPE